MNTFFAFFEKQRRRMPKPFYISGRVAADVRSHPPFLKGNTIERYRGSFPSLRRGRFFAWLARHDLFCVWKTNDDPVRMAKEA